MANWNTGPFTGYNNGHQPPNNSDRNHNNNNQTTHGSATSYSQGMNNNGGWANNGGAGGNFAPFNPNQMNQFGGSAFFNPPPFDPFMMGGSMMNMNMMGGSMMNMNMNVPPPNIMQSPPPNNNHNNLHNNNQHHNTSQSMPQPYAFPPPQPNQHPQNMQPPMNPLQQMQQSGSFYANNNMQAPPGNNMPPPPPIGVSATGASTVDYEYDQNLQPVRGKKKKRKKSSNKKNKQNALSTPQDNDYGLSAPQPRPRTTSRSKVNRIRHSFLMTGKNNMAALGVGGAGLTGAIPGSPSHGQQNSAHAMPGFNANGTQEKAAPAGEAVYTERRKKRVAYSAKETEKMKAKLLSAESMKRLAVIKDVKQRNKLVMKKLHLCKYVCDFRAAGDAVIVLDSHERKRIDNKLELLTELYRYLKSNPWQDSMGPGADLTKFLESLFKMLAHNLFRVLPDAYIKEAIKTDTSGKDAKITISKEVPAWKHFEVMYKIFEEVLKTMKNDDASQKLLITQLENFNVISNVIYLLNTEEVREEEAVANVISLLYQEYRPVRLFVLGQLSNVCYSYLYINNQSAIYGRDELEKHRNQREYNKQLAVGVKTVLMIFKQCLESADDEELDGWVELLCAVIIPLHKAPISEFSIFDDALGKISVTFCEKYFLSFVYIFQGLLRYWPVTSSKKEQLFLHRIGPLLDTADEDLWEFRDKTQCEYHAVFTVIASRVVDAVANYQHAHYATAEKVFDMLADDTLQRFVDIYGGRDCWLRLYKSLHDIASKYFWKETIDKCAEFMENCKEEDDVPMKYVDAYEKIESGELFGDATPSEMQQGRVQQKRAQRQKYWQHLESKHQRRNVAAYQKHVYKNNQPTLQMQPQPPRPPRPVPPSRNSMKNVWPPQRPQIGQQNMHPPPPPQFNQHNQHGLPSPMWDEDDF